VAGLVGVRLGFSAIPLYIGAGIILGPGEPVVLHVVTPTEGLELLSDLGIVLLLFFLGLEFSLERLTQARRSTVVGGAIDLAIAGGGALALSLLLLGPGAEAVILAGLIYVSSSAVITRALFDFRRLADPETDLVLGVLVFEDVAIALFLGVAAALASGGDASPTGVAATAAIALLVVGAFLAASKYTPRIFDRFAPRLEREQLLLLTLTIAIGSAAIAEGTGLSEAIGALLAGVLLSGSQLRDQIEQELLGLRDFAAGVFFFSFGLGVDLGETNLVWIWLLAAIPIGVATKMIGGYVAGQATGLTRARSFNAGTALVARGEFTIILSQLAAAGVALDAGFRERIEPFAGVFVVATTVIGVLFMKESRRIGRAIFAGARGVQRQTRSR
jgi:monovalent cation:H+ antiporter-2, CPA2 family